MTAQEVKSFFRYVWGQRVLIAWTMLVTGIIDLVGGHNFGAGFVFGFLALIVMAIFSLAKRD
jgi:hypothetical protein